MTDSESDALDRQLALLPLDVVPPATLWPQVMFGIARRHREIRSIGYAAVAACALLASVLIWAVLRGEGSARLLVVTAQSGFEELKDVRYVAARTALQAVYRQRLALLDPVTRAHVQASLEVIQQAREEIRDALAAEPANAVLEHLFESTWHDEFDLYDDVVRATQPNATRT